MTSNNFKQLEEEQEQQYPHAPKEVENQIMGSMRVSHFMGNIIELFLPRVFDVILNLFGSSSKSKKEENPKDENVSKDSGDIPPGHPKSDL